MGKAIAAVRMVALGAGLRLPTGPTGAEAFVPKGDDVVLEHLPEGGDSRLGELKRMRAQLRGTPGDVELAIRVARRALEAARTLGDPRFLRRSPIGAGTVVDR